MSLLFAGLGFLKIVILAAPVCFNIDYTSVFFIIFSKHSISQKKNKFNIDVINKKNKNI